MVNIVKVHEKKENKNKLLQELSLTVRSTYVPTVIKDIVKGELYHMTNYAVMRQHNGQMLPYIFETVTDRDLVCVINNEFKRKYAVYSNDSEESGLNSQQSAMMVATIGDIINYVDFLDDNEDGSFNIYSFKYVKPVTNPDTFSESITIEVECIDVNTTISYPEWCKELVSYIDNTISRIGIPIQLIDKFSYNNSRCIGFGVFQRNGEGDLVMNRLGKQYKVNNRSRLYTNPEGGLVRFFYSKKFRNADEILVDGVYIPEECINYDINDFMENKNFVENISEDVVRIVTTVGNFYGYIQNNGRIKLIIRLGKTYKFIHLSDDEASTLVREINAI